MSRRVLFLFGVVLGLVLCQGQGRAGTFGKITGVVSDGNGNLLPGANVVLEGLPLGATTDASGNFTILRVDPGPYIVRASMVGYTSQAKTEVWVSADRTTHVDFELVEEAIQASEIRVEAVRPPVEKDRTSSTYTMNIEAIEKTPGAKDVVRLLELQGGVNPDGKLSIRGNQGTYGYWGGSQVEVYVDGVPMHGVSMYRLGVVQGGTPNLGVTASSIGELSVIAGGFGADYGGGAGVINVITRTASDRLHGRVEYKATPPGKKHWGPNVYEEQNPLWWNTSDPSRRRMRWSDPEWANETVTYTDALTGQTKTVSAHERMDYTGIWGHWAEATVSGPITDKLNFLASGNLELAASILPSPTSHGFYGNKSTLHRGADFRPGDGSYQTNAKLTAQITPAVKMNVGASYRWLGLLENYDASWLGTSQPFMADYAGAKATHTTTLLYSTLTHVLNPKTFYEVRLSWYRENVDTTRAGLDNASLLPILADPVMDRDNFFTIYPGMRTAFYIEDTRRLRLAADITSQITNHHLIKAGFEINRDQFASLHGRWIQAGPRRWDWVGKGYFYQVGTPLSDALRGVMRTAVYAQDKIEFEGLIVNVGVRYDRFDHLDKFVPMGAGLWMVNPATFSWTKSRYAPLVDMKPLQALSPRFGVSHPITASSIIRLAFTQSRTLGSMRLFYVNGWDGGSGALSAMDKNGNGRVDLDEFLSNNTVRGWAGNGELDYETHTAFEVGTDWNFYQDYTVAMTAYYRSGTDVISGGNPYFWDPQTGSSVRGSQGFYNQNIIENRGYEVSLRKGLSRDFSFMLSFNQQWQYYRHLREHQVILPDSRAIAEGAWYWTRYSVDPATGREIPVPLTQEEIQALGAKADAKLEAIRNHTDNEWDPNFSSELEPVPGVPGLWFYRDRYVPGFSQITNTPGGYGGETSSRGWGKASFTYTSPSDRGRLLGGWRVNLLYSIEEAGAFFLTSDRGREIKYGPIRTNLDMAVEKDLRLRPGTTVTLYALITNLLNNRDVLTSGSGAQADWYNMGLVGPRPDDSTFRERGGDPNYLNRYWGYPRFVDLGVRVSF